jgi:DNA-binding IclR family transcriptional regulator
MFKTDLSLTNTCKKLYRENGWAFMGRGLASNVTAVAAPIAMTIFFTDLLMSMKKYD